MDSMRELRGLRADEFAMNNNASPTVTTTERHLVLKSLHVRNLRRIAELDVEFPESTRVICLVGANGSGKSSLLSILAHSLSLLTHESIPDCEKDGKEIEGDDVWRRNHDTGEIRQGSPALLVKADWLLNDQKTTYIYAVRRSQDWLRSREEFGDLLDGPSLNFLGDQITMGGWNNRPRQTSDPVARSVLLVRPADRWERANYDEPYGLVATPFVLSHWIDYRPFPIQVRSFGIALEQMLMHLTLDTMRGIARTRVMK